MQSCFPYRLAFAPVNCIGLGIISETLHLDSNTPCGIDSGRIRDSAIPTRVVGSDHQSSHYYASTIQIGYHQANVSILYIVSISYSFLSLFCLTNSRTLHRI